MPERLSNLGYFSLKKEATKGVAVIPDDYLPLYDESLKTNGNLIDLDPIYGAKYSIFNTIQGNRTHGGDITTIAEPNTTAKLMDMLLTKVSTTGANPYVHTFELSNTANPNSYTVDISTGNIVRRYFGVEASGLAENWNNNEKQHKLTVSALGSFQGREIASVNVNSIVLKTDYDAAPTKGLVSADLVRLYKPSTGATLDTTVTTVDANGTTLVLGASAAAFAAGDLIHLRPATPVFSSLIQTSLQWAKTFFKFGATAAAAGSAAQTRLESGSGYSITHSFEDDGGANRSGGYDPAALIRTTGKLEVKVKKFFDTAEDIAAFNALSKSAIVIDNVAGSTNQFGVRLIANHIKTESPTPALKNNGIVYMEQNYHPIYDQTDGKAFSVVVTNGIPTI